MKITLLCNGQSEISWYILNELIKRGIECQAILQGGPGHPGIKAKLRGLYDKANIVFTNALVRNYQPVNIAKPDLAGVLITKDLNTPAVEEWIRTFGPDVIAISGTKKINEPILKLAPLALNLHHGMVPLYRGVSSPQWVLYEKNFSYFMATIHRAAVDLDAGEVYGDVQLIPRFPETFAAFRRRLLLEGADEFIEVLTNPKRWANSVPQAGPARNLRHGDKPKGFGEVTTKISRSADWFRYSAIQAAPTSRVGGAMRSLYLKRTNNEVPPGLYIVNYHDICNAEEVAAFDRAGVPSIYTSYEKFLEHLSLYRDQFELVSLQDGIERLRAGEARRKRLLAITFDDGIKTAGLALDELEVAPTFFVCGDPLFTGKPLAINVKLFDIRGSADYFSVDDLKVLVGAKKVALGSHTASHRTLAKMSVDEQRQEIKANHQAIEAAVGVKMNMFSHPFGKLTRRDLVSHYVASETAEHVFDCNGGINQNGDIPGNLLRIGIHNENRQELLRLLSSQWMR